MKAKFITPADVKAAPRGKATITLGKSGVIALSGVAVQKIGLVADDEVSIFEDETSEGDFYICKTPKGEQGFELRPINNHDGSKSLGFNSKGLITKILGSTDETTRFQVAIEHITVDKIKAFAILTSSRS
jgi:hypothetical protein